MLKRINQSENVAAESGKRRLELLSTCSSFEMSRRHGCRCCDTAPPQESSWCAKAHASTPRAVESHARSNLTRSLSHTYTHSNTQRTTSVCLKIHTAQGRTPTDARIVLHHVRHQLRTKGNSVATWQARGCEKTLLPRFFSSLFFSFFL